MEEDKMIAEPRLKGFGSKDGMDRDFLDMLGRLGMGPGPDGNYTLGFDDMKALLLAGSCSGIYTMTEALSGALGGNVSRETMEAIRSLADTVSDAVWDMAEKQAGVR